MGLGAATLRMFTALRLMRVEWTGPLVLGVGLREGGQAFALATLGVGAAGLFLESDAAAMRVAQRLGCCTFAVTTLDEALRALKNEVRQGRAITVGLSGDPMRWIAEMVERGVLPAVVASESPVQVSRLIAWGARTVRGFGMAGLGDDALDLEAVLAQATEGRWVMGEDMGGSLAERRSRDVALMGEYADGDPVSHVMRQWLRVAPSLFARDRARDLWVTP